MPRKTDRPKPQLIRCPICQTEMSRLPEERQEVYLCGECGTHYELESGKLKELTEKGEYIELGFVKAEEKPIQHASAYDVYFTSKDKRRFVGIVELGHEKGWMILTNRTGKQVLINSDKVNFVEEVG